MKEINYDTELEMAQSASVLANFDDAVARQLGKKIAGRPIYFTGMGSSLIFPAANAKKRAALLLPDQKIEIAYISNIIVENIPQSSYIFLASNSGRTVEILAMADSLKKRGIEFFGITTNSDSPLAELCKNDLYVLQAPFERGVAATKSVIEQGLFYDALIHSIANKEFPLNKGKKESKRVCDLMTANFDFQLAENVVSAGIFGKTYYWIDHDNGAGEELALKSCEIAGKRGVYESGTQILHGRGEVIKKNDLVFVLDAYDYSQKDLESLAGLTKKTGSKLVVVGKNEDEKLRGLKLNEFYFIHADVEKGFEAYCVLPACWNFLRDVGKATGRNIDFPEIAEKARVA